jgi:molecular chaperone GrpE (heat shock protein)
LDEDRLQKLAELLEEVAEDNTTIAGSLGRLMESQEALRSDVVRELDALREDFRSALVFRALKEVCRELVPPLAAMEAMLKHADFSNEAIIRGHVESLAITVQTVLGRLGVEKISVSPGEEMFDSSRHLCVRMRTPAESPFPSVAPRTVVRVVEDGYVLAGRILSPAKVEVQTEEQAVNES